MLARALLEDDSSVLDAIRTADEEIKNKVEKFAVEKCKSLLHMVYHPREDRFYKQVARACLVRATSVSLQKR